MVMKNNIRGNGKTIDQLIKSDGLLKRSSTSKKPLERKFIKKGPLHFCEMALRKYSVSTK